MKTENLNKYNTMMKSTLKLRRLGWAGVEIAFGNETLLIDYIQDTKPLVQLRSEHEVFLASSQPGKASAALVTHLHPDHADPEAIALAVKKNAPVLRPEPAKGTEADLALTNYVENKFSQYDLDIEFVKPWEERVIGSFKIWSTPAVCGFGDPQVSWVIECGGKKIFHSGDSIFHGSWWRIANHFGPIDVAFLPVNGPIIDFHLLQPSSSLEAVMTPEQAVEAAKILQARLFVPIHYGSLHRPPDYVETENILARLESKSKETNTLLSIKQPGDWFELD